MLLLPSPSPPRTTLLRQGTCYVLVAFRVIFMSSLFLPDETLVLYFTQHTWPWFPKIEALLTKPNKTYWNYHWTGSEEWGKGPQANIRWLCFWCLLYFSLNTTCRGLGSLGLLSLEKHLSKVAWYWRLFIIFDNGMFSRPIEAQILNFSTGNVTTSSLFFRSRNSHCHFFLLHHYVGGSFIVINLKL